MIRLVFIGENKDFSDYSMRYGDIYEFEKNEKKSESYLVIQVRNGVKTVIGLFALPLEEHMGKYFITLAEWREQQIKSILDD
jgi:hypothetical protein